MKMKKTGLENVSESGIDDKLDTGAYTIDGVNYALLGGESAPEG